MAADGSRRALDVVGNVYVELFDRVATALPQTLEFGLDGERRTFPVPVPSDLLDSECMRAPPGAPTPPANAG